MSSEWAQRFVDEDDGEPELIDVTPASTTSSWFLSEMASHRADAHKRRIRTTRYGTRAIAWLAASMLPLPFWATSTAFVFAVVIGLFTILEAERWLSAHVSARAKI